MGSNEWQTVYRSTFGDDEPMACLFTAGVGTVRVGTRASQTQYDTHTVRSNAYEAQWHQSGLEQREHSRPEKGGLQES